jgi:hypothetical protein
MANISTDFSTWSGTAASNQPDSGDTATVQADLQAIQAAIRTVFPAINGAVLPTHTELNYVDGVTSAIQTQLNARTTSVAADSRVQNQSAIAFTTTGTSSAYVGAPSPAISANTENQCFFVEPHTDPTGSPTLAINGFAALNCKYLDAANVKQFITSSQVKAGNKYRVWNDGTDYIWGDISSIEFASNAEYATGTDTVKPLNSAVARARNIVAGTAIATTSGTSHDFTGIPSWAKRITVMVSAVSVSGTASPTIQLGDAGGVENTGYIGAVSVVAAGSTAAANLSSGFQFSSTGAAAQTYQGTLTLTLLDSATNLWSCSGCIGRTDTAVGAFVGGSKALSATLDRIRLTTTNGTDTFDAGSINILYE